MPNRITIQQILLCLSCLFPGLKLMAQPNDCTWDWSQTSAFTIDCPSIGYELEWEDNFDGNLLNTTLWSVADEYASPPLDRIVFHEGQAEGAIYLDDNVVVENGRVRLEVRRENVNYPGIWGQSYNSEPDLVGTVGTPFSFNFKYSSGRILAKKNIQSKHSLKIDVRMKLPEAYGLWPAFWSFHHPTEVDFLEIFETQSDNTFQAGLIQWRTGGNHNCEKDIPIPSSGFHLYSAEITPWVVKLSIDGQILVAFYKYYTSDGIPVGYNCNKDYPAGLYRENEAFPLKDNWLGPILNLAVSRNLANLMWAQEDALEIDYVKVYSKKECSGEEGVISLTNTDLEINGNHSYENIEVGFGRTLTIKNANIQLSKEGSITVLQGGKLIIENSDISSVCSTWKGIHAIRSFNLPAIVEIKNSTIRQAITGILLGSPVNPGLTIMPKLTVSNNSIIKDCQTGIHFMNGVNKSTIDNTTFSNNRVGIFLNDSYGVRVNNSTFNEQTQGIHVFDSKIILEEGNTFSNSERGILSEGTLPISTGLILGKEEGIPNTFINLKEGIVFSGNYYPTGSQILNCKFESITSDAVNFFGENFYNIQNCSFKNVLNGANVHSAGDGWPNRVQCNTFESVSWVGAQFMRFNGGTQFLENSFEGEDHETHFSFFSANMADEIGEAINPAGNCFSNSAQDFYFSYFFPGASKFDYHFYKENTLDPCQESVAQPNDYNKIEENFIPDNCFGFIGPFGLIGEDPIGIIRDNPAQFTDPICFPCVIDKINIAKANYQSVGGQDLSSTFIENRITNAEVQKQRDILVHWINYGLYLSVEKEDWAVAESILSPLAGYDWKKLHFGIKMKQGNFEQAKILLDALPEVNQEVSYFKYVQGLNLRIKDATNSNNFIDSGELEQLKTIGLSDQPSSGYARSLYHALKGEELESPFVALLISSPRQSEKKAHELTPQKNIYIYPNPATDLLTISADFSETFGLLEIRTLTGTLQISRQLDGEQHIIPLNDLNSGIYFLNVIDENGAIQYQDKLIIQ